MSAESRRRLIGDLQSALGRDHRVIAYVTGGRQWKGRKEGINTQIAQDAVRLCYDHVLRIAESVPRDDLTIDLFLFSYGGDTSAPWRLVSMFREFARQFNVVVPFTAMSAATLICLGADEIIMGRKGELGPIDPSVSGDPAMLKIEGERPPIGVEDVTSYVSFVRERCRLRRKELVSRALGRLADQLGPIGLGRLNRQHAYIRLVGRRLLESRNNPNKRSIRKILRSLIEDVTYHGHAISRSEAKQLGVHVSEPEPDIEAVIWKLYREFEEDFRFRKPLDENEWLSSAPNQDTVDSDEVVVAGIESAKRTDNFVHKFRFRRLRELPPKLNIALQLPGNIDLTADQQAVVQQLMQHVLQQVGPAVQATLRAQCPVKELRRELLTAEWRNTWEA